MISEKDKELLEKWIDGRMNSQERALFEARFEQEPHLAQEAQLRLDMDRYLRKRAARNRLKSEIESIRNAPKRVRPITKMRVVWRRRMQLIAAAAAIGLIVIWWIGRPNPLDQFATHPPLSLTQRSSTNQELATRAAKLFAEGHYLQAAQVLDTLHRQHPSDTLSLLYQGIALFKAGHYDEAVALLTPFPKGGNWTTEAWYFAALAYAKKGEREKAIRLLQQIPPQSGRYQQAQKIIQYLK